MQFASLISLSNHMLHILGDMDYIKSLDTSHLIIGLTSIFAILIAATMGLFNKNQMPVEGKVRTILLQSTRSPLSPDKDRPHNRWL